MNLQKYGIEEKFYQIAIGYIEELKELLSSKVWENIFLNCSKNEVFVFWLLYQRGEANMTEIAEYIHVPLNTATGIISRMEKQELVVRTRSTEDKRVVTIGFSEKGRQQFEELASVIMDYGVKVTASFTKEEMELFYKMTAKIIEVLKQENEKKEVPKKVRKIRIE